MIRFATAVQRLPFYYGWVIVGIAFVTMAISVSSRTAFSLLLPPLTQEFGWSTGTVAAAFSVGFMTSAILSPLAGRIMDRYGPRVVIQSGIALMAAGLFLGANVQAVWQLYLTLGVLALVGANLMSFVAQSLYLPHWFVRRRGLAMGVAFSGVGVGAVLILPWLQTIIETDGWRAACTTMGVLAIVVLVPINLLVRHRPQALGLLPDGDASAAAAAGKPGMTIVDPVWAAREWTLGAAVRTGRFWLLALGYFMGLFGWYAVQIHQTKYLIDIGYSPFIAAWALGVVSIVGISGQVGFGALSDRIGREAAWSIGCLGFAIAYALLILMETMPSMTLLYLMVLSQGVLGYAMPAVMGPMTAEIFEGPHYGTVFGTLTIAILSGGAAGPWIAGMIHDATGGYRAAFALAIGCCAVSAAAIWLAGPRKVRRVPGHRVAAA